MLEEISGRGKKSPLVDPRAAESVTPRSMVPQIPSEETGDVQEKERIQRAWERTHEELQAAGHVCENHSGICAQEHVAGRRRGKALGV